MIAVKKILILLFIFFFSLTLGGCEEVVSPIDEVTKYEITLEPRNDGSMDMVFSFDWKVLNDTREGPLTWLIIGIPNEHVDEITALTGNIENIGYSSYQGGSFVRIDFTEPTHADETIHFAFSTHQSHLYNIEKGFVDYSYQPGWFSEIEVKQAIVRWKKTNVLVNNANSEDDNYWIWDYPLNFGETIEVHVRYSELSFPELDYGATNGLSPKDSILIIIIIK